MPAQMITNYGRVMALGTCACVCVWVCVCVCVCVCVTLAPYISITGASADQGRRNLPAQHWVARAFDISFRAAAKFGNAGSFLKLKNSCEANNLGGAVFEWRRVGRRTF